jgi:hypothetical protein
MLFQSPDSWDQGSSSPGDQAEAVCHLEGWSFRLSLDQPFDEALVELASKVQDNVMDRHRVAWPGHDGQVLTPTLLDDGGPVWLDEASGARWPIGALPRR